MPLIVGDARRWRCGCARRALERGVFAQAIRPPTVPAGTSRLRLAVMASHTRSELRDAAQTLARAALAAGFQPGAAEPIVAAHDAARARVAATAPFDVEAAEFAPEPQPLREAA